MNIHDLTADQLKRAAVIKEQIAALNRELSAILASSATDGAVTNNYRTMNASTRRKIAAAQKGRWARLRRAKAGSGRPAAKKRMSPAARAKLSAKMKRYWAAKKAGEK